MGLIRLENPIAENHRLDVVSLKYLLADNRHT